MCTAAVLSETLFGPAAPLPNNSEFFVQGAMAPEKGILLFGPPGTGKSLVGRCIASQVQASFISISAADLVGKWYGDGEKKARALFAVAACLQPTIIFIDEIDAVLSARTGDGW